MINPYNLLVPKLHVINFKKKMLKHFVLIIGFIRENKLQLRKF